jgi:hypothetical protein
MMNKKILFIGNSQTSFFIDAYKTADASKKAKAGFKTPFFAALGSGAYAIPKISELEEKTLVLKGFDTYTWRTSDGNDTIDLSNISGIVFTSFCSPLRFRNQTIVLHDQGFDTYYQDKNKSIHTTNINDKPFLLSPQALYEIFKADTPGFINMLFQIRQFSPTLPIFITPTLLPIPGDEKFAAQEWRKYFHQIASLIPRYIAHEFNTHYCPQPPESISEDYFTLREYSNNDSHHFNKQFVFKILESSEYQTFLNNT